jgi:hypothetical protein
MKGATCYMCDNPATSEEHVPPKCLFPRDPALRRSLIRVPSCDIHNLRKSKDDELLRHILVAAPGNNRHCLSVVETGVIPAFERRPHILETFLPNLTGMQVGDFKTASFTIDVPRFEASIQAIVRGLFFHETGGKLAAALTVVWGALLTPDRSRAPFLSAIRAWQKRLRPIDRGANPEIFRYAFDQFSGGESHLCRLQFYEGHPIYIGWRSSEATDS